MQPKCRQGAEALQPSHADCGTRLLKQIPLKRSRSGASPFPSQSTTVQSRRTTLPVGRCAPPPPFPPPAVIASQRRGLRAGEALPGGWRWSGAPGPRAAELRSRGVLPVAPSRGRGAAHEVKMVIRVFVASSSGSVAVSGSGAQPAGPGQRGDRAELSGGIRHVRAVRWGAAGDR